MPFDARILRSRSALRNALLTLLGRKSLDTIAIRDITREAGVSSATFYRHYQTRSDVLEDAAIEEMKILIDETVPILRARGSRTAALAICKHVDERRVIWASLLGAGAAGAMRTAYKEHLRQVPPVPGIKRFDGPEDLRLSVDATAFIEVLSWWLDIGKEYSVEQMAEFLDRLLMGIQS